MSTRPAHDVVVVGDGPAGLALGAACAAEGLDVVVVGEGRPWTATYGTFVDEVPDHAEELVAPRAVDVVAVGRRTLGRRYATFDLARLRERLDVAPRASTTVAAVRHHGDRADVELASGEVRAARLVVEATGGGPTVDVPVQTAYGLVVDHRPEQVGGEGAVLMDWRPPSPAHADEATFLYVVPLARGRWLVEETSLARRRPMAPEQLRARLAARLGTDLTPSALAVEHVAIPMRPGLPERRSLTVRFGAAARYGHPATGYSVAASLRAAPRVAAAAARAVAEPDPRVRALRVWDAVWPAEHRRARALHDYGLATLLRLPPDDVRAFFEAFFALPEEQWSAYLRIDTDAATVARAMAAVFSAVPWRLRRRLAAGSPASFARVLR